MWRCRRRSFLFVIFFAGACHHADSEPPPKLPTVKVVTLQKQRVAPQVAVAGSVKNPGIYELNGESTAGDVVQLAGGLSAVADAQLADLQQLITTS